MTTKPAPRKVSVNFADAPHPPAPPAPPAERAWSEQQQAIFRWFETSRVGDARSQHLVVRARAGTGKTTTIFEGMKRAPEHQVLYAVFNKDIAREAQSRVTDRRIEVKTYAALGLRYIRRNWRVEVEEDDQRGGRALRLARRAAPDAIEPVQKLIALLHTKARELAPRATVADVVDIAFRFDLVPDDAWDWDTQAVAKAAHTAMRFAREQTAVVDFADMIYLPIVMNWVRPWFDLVVVDEAQDMTEPQLEIVRGACRRDGRVCVVGDDMQAIYEFRGADVGALDRMKGLLGAAELGLTITFRCGSLIVDLARQLVPDYRAAPGAATGEIARCDVDQLTDDAREGDFVISRKNAPLVGVCMALLKQGTRARIRGRDVGRGVIALIRRMRAATIADLEPKLEAYVEREIRKASKLSDAAREVREAFVRDQRDIVVALCEGVDGVAALEQRVHQLFSDEDGRGAVMCSTVHRAKGLEADRTFLLEGTFRPGEGEELRLRYVAITRARTRLCWVSGFGKQEKAS